MNKQDIIISLLKEIDKNIDNVNDSGGTNANLEELTITSNGTYTPQEGVDGFSKVVASINSNFIKTNGCVLEDNVPEEYIDIFLGNKPIVEYDDEKMQKFSGIYSNAPLKYIMPEAKRIYLPHVTTTNVDLGMFRDLVYLEELNLPNLTTCQFSTNFANLTSIQYISLPSLDAFVGNSNFIGCTNLVECDLPKWRGPGYAAMFNGCTSLKRLKTGKITTGFGTNQWLHQSPDFIDLEIGEGTDVNLILSTMNPTNVLADAEKTAIFNANIRNHIAAKVIGQHTITFHANVKAALEQETIDAFIEKGWIIA